MAVKNWEVVGEGVTLAGKFGKKLFMVQFRNPNTGTIEDYVQFAQKDWSVCLAVTSDGNVIVEREFKQGRRCVEDELPAGTAEGTESPTDVMQRELLEETGYQAGTLISLGDAWTNTRSSPTRFHCFVALNCHKVAEPHLDVNEDIETRLVPLSEWLQLVVSGEIREPSAVVATCRALPHLGLGIGKF